MSSRADMDDLAAKIIRFVRSRSTGWPGEYTMCTGGHATLYASCFAAMTLHYLGELDKIPAPEKQAWVDYLQRWQDVEPGLFVGPELTAAGTAQAGVDWEYHTMHLTVHVLPALHALGAQPRHPITFARRFLDLSYLQSWLDRRDWRDPWREGNNLLFVGQLLVHLREVEGRPEADHALRLYFDWLDAAQDPRTGVWGTQEGGRLSYAVYGAYHQLLAYCCCARPVHYADRIVDSVLGLQHADGGFEPTGGGGACQDVDCADILVKLGGQLGHRPDDIRAALRRLVVSILDKMAPDGGFVYRHGEPFIHHGLLWTYTPPDIPDLFSTWFRTHTLALVSQFLKDEPIAEFPWRFNTVCSMGWHDSTRPAVVRRSSSAVSLPAPPHGAPVKGRQEHSLIARARSLLVGQPSRRLLAHLPPNWAAGLIVEFVERYISRCSPEDALRFLLKLDERIFPWTEQLAVDYTAHLLPGAWPARRHHEFFAQRLGPDQIALHTGCATGELTYTLATVTGAEITGTDCHPELIAIARSRYHHPRLSYLAGDPLYELRGYHCDTIIVDEAAELAPGNPAYLRQLWDALGPARILMRLPRQASTWQALLRRQMSIGDARALTVRNDASSTHFLERLAEFGLSTAHSEARWGETWLEVVDRDAHDEK